MKHDEFADALAARYEIALLAASAVYLNGVAAGVEITPHSVVTARRTIERIMLSFLSDATREVDGYARALDVGDDFVPLMVRRAGILDRLSQALRENQTQLTNLLRTGRRDYTRVILSGRGAIGMLMQRKAAGVEFRVSDAAGRQWAAKTLVRSLLRDFAYQSYLDARFEHMARAGVVLARAVHPDGRPGSVFSLTGSDLAGHPPLREVRAAIFHPNSNADVTHV